VGQLVFKTVKLGYLTIIPVLVFTVFFPEYILAIFSPDGTIISSAVMTLMVIVIATLVAVPADIIASAVAGTGDTMVTLGIELIVSLCVLGYAYYAAFIASFSLESIWIAEIIGWSVCLLLSWAWLRSGVWKRLNI
jgi:Na+-driven multidrug efflux pump